MKEESGNKKKEESKVEGSLVPQKMVKRFKQLKKLQFQGKRCGRILGGKD